MYTSKKTFALFLLQDIREGFPNLWSRVGFIAGIFFELLIYWYTAKAFGPKLQDAVSGIEQGYFYFVVLGEATLLFPMALMGAFVAGARQARSNGILEVLLTEPLNDFKTLIILGLGAILRMLIQLLLFLFFAVGFFGFSIPFSNLLWTLFLQVAVIPLFLFMGISLSGLFLRFGRGAGVTSSITQLVAVLAGVYFPTNVFPAWLKEGLIYLSPYNAMLELTRLGPSAIKYGAVASLGGWTVFLFLFCIWIVPHGIYHVRKRGTLDLPNL